MEYQSPATAKQAATLLHKAKGKAFVLAGGTDLLAQMRAGMVAPDLVVDVKNINEMSTIKVQKSGIRVGAAVSNAALGENKQMTKAWPGVVEAANLIGSTQIQGRSTMGGNLCNASPAADAVPAMVAAGAKANITGPRGKRTVPVEKIPTGPGKTSLKKGEIVTSFDFPKRAPKSGDAYLRFIPRTEMDIAVVGAAVNLTIDAKGVIKSARVSLGAVAPTVLLVPGAAKAIIGSKLDDEALDNLAAACEAVCKPISDKRGTAEYRTEVAGVLAKRAALIAYKRAGGKK